MRRRSRSLWSEAGVVLAGNVLARGLGFLFPLVLARAMSKGDFGTAYFAIGTGFFVGELVLTGFPTALTRFVAAEGSRGAWLSSAIVGGLPLLAVSIVVGEGLAIAAGAPAGLTSIVVVGLSIDAYYFGLLRGMRRFRLLAAYSVSANLAQIVLLGAAIVVGLQSVTLAVLIYSFVYLAPIAAIEAMRAPLRTALRDALWPEAATVRKLTRFAVPALVSGMAYAGICQADVLFMGLLAKPQLADYAAAKSLAQPMALAPYAIAIVMLPAVASASVEQRWRMLVRALCITLGLNICLLGVYLAGRSVLVGAVLPGTFAAAAASLPLIAAGVTAMGVHTVMSQWSMGIGRPALPAMSLVFGALAATGLQLVLTPAHGAIGAAIAVLCGALLADAALGVAIVRTRRETVGTLRHEQITDQPAVT